MFSTEGSNADVTIDTGDCESDGVLEHQLIILFQNIPKKNLLFKRLWSDYLPALWRRFSRTWCVYKQGCASPRLTSPQPDYSDVQCILAWGGGGGALMSEGRRGGRCSDSWPLPLKIVTRLGGLKINAHPAQRR